MRLARTITVHRYAEDHDDEDRYGNPRTSYTPETVRVYFVAPRAVSEPAEPMDRARTPVVSGLVIGAPLDVAIGPHDRIEVNGATYEVEGEPQPFEKSPVSVGLRVEGQLITIKKRTG